MDIIIREAALEDYKAVADICRDDLGYDCSDELVKLRLNNLDDNRERVFVAYCDKAVVGFIHAERYDALYFKTVVNLLGLAVSKEYRKNGIGRLLLNECEKWAKSIGAGFIRANSGEYRFDAHTFYRNSGYNNEKKQIRFLKELS